MSRKVWQRGDIVVGSFDPTLGQEQQGRRPRQGGDACGFEPAGHGWRLPCHAGRHGRTQRGAVGEPHGHRHANARRGAGAPVQDDRTLAARINLIEQAPDDLVEEVGAWVAAMLD